MPDKFFQVLNAQQCQRLLGIAHARASARGLGREETDDCAIAFIGHLLQQIDLHPHTTLPRLHSLPWIFRCADNWAKNYVRQHHRRLAHEHPWPQEEAEEADPQAEEFASEMPTPEQQLLNYELISRMDMAMRRLTPVQRDIFHRHCIEGETLAHIAETTDRSPEAVRQSFCLLRKRLQCLLMETGLSSSEAMDYLYQTLTNHHH